MNTTNLPISKQITERIRPYRSLLGCRPDGEIAQLANIDRRYVLLYRKKHSIEPYQRSTNPSKKHRRSKLDEYRNIIGIKSDIAVAEIIGCSREAIMRYRKRYGIAAAPRSKSEFKKQEEPKQYSLAFLVTTKDEKLVIPATDIGEAMEKGKKYFRKPIILVQLLGEIIT